jgi:hypothetical protein
MANVKDVVSTNADLVNYLLVNKFHTLSYDGKIFVKKLPVPQPSMVDLIQSKSGHNRAFSKTLCQKHIWLTGSQLRNKLFCWYCVLFSVNKNPYNTVGYENLKEIHRALVKQEISNKHTHSAIKFKLFGKQNIVNTIDSGHKEYIIKYNEKVRENREMVKRLINITIFLSTQELAW